MSATMNTTDTTTNAATTTAKAKVPAPSKNWKALLSSMKKKPKRKAPDAEEKNDREAPQTTKKRKPLTTKGKATTTTKTAKTIATRKTATTTTTTATAKKTKTTTTTTKPSKEVFASSEIATTEEEEEQEPKGVESRDLWFGDDISPADLELAYGKPVLASANVPKNKKKEVEVEIEVEVRNAKEPVKNEAEDGQKRIGNVKGTTATLSVPSVTVEEMTTTAASATEKVGKYVAVDCEMVGVGPKGCESALARVSIVNYHGAVVMDKYVKPQEPVTDYRTFVSGITPDLLRDADDFKTVQEEVSKIFEGRIVVGHSIKNDFAALMLNHPHLSVRDTATYSKFKDLAKTKRPGLKKLSLLVLNKAIQEGGHSSVEDARHTMLLYRFARDDWETELKMRSSKPVKKKKNKSSAVTQQSSLTI